MSKNVEIPEEILSIEHHACPSGIVPTRLPGTQTSVGGNESATTQLAVLRAQLADALNEVDALLNAETPIMTAGE